jgi:plasmid maintenance system antidote protein VapI
MSIKEPMHPGKVLDIIIDDLYSESILYKIKSREYLCINAGIPEDALELLLNEKLDISYVSAFKLGKSIPGTDMAFWLKLQKDYDDYVESSIDKDMSESISQLDANDFCNETRVFGTAHFKEEGEVKSAPLSARDKITHILGWVETAEYASTSEAYTYCKDRPHIDQFSSDNGYDNYLYVIADEIISLIKGELNEKS